MYENQSCKVFFFFFFESSVAEKNKFLWWGVITTLTLGILRVNIETILDEYLQGISGFKEGKSIFPKLSP